MVDLYAPERFSVRAALARPFRIAGDRPGAFWALLICDLVTAGLVACVIGTLMLASFSASAALGEPMSAEAAAQQMRSMAAMLAAYPVLALYGVVSEAAWYRLLTDRTPHRFPPYRLGMDEARVFVVYLVLFGLMYAALFVVMIVVFIVMAIGGLGLGAADESTLAWLPLLLAPLFLVLYFTVLITLMRFIVGVAVSVASRKIRIFSGWTATRGSAWRFFAAVIAVLAIYTVTALVLLSVVALASGVTSTQTGAIFVMVPLYFALLTFVYLLLRGVYAEAAMTLLTRERKQAAEMADAAKKAGPNPPASPDGPGRAPEGV